MVDFGAAGGGAWLADPATRAPTLAAFDYAGASADPTPDGGAILHVYFVAGGSDLPAWLAGRAGERRARVDLVLPKPARDAVAAGVGGFARWLVPAAGGAAHKGSMCVVVKGKREGREGRGAPRPTRPSLHSSFSATFPQLSLRPVDAADNNAAPSPGAAAVADPAWIASGGGLASIAPPRVAVPQAPWKDSDAPSSSPDESDGGSPMLAQRPPAADATAATGATAGAPLPSKRGGRLALMGAVQPPLSQPMAVDGADAYAPARGSSSSEEEGVGVAGRGRGRGRGARSRGRGRGPSSRHPARRAPAPKRARAASPSSESEEEDGIEGTAPSPPRRAARSASKAAAAKPRKPRSPAAKRAPFKPKPKAKRAKPLSPSPSPSPSPTPPAAWPASRVPPTLGGAPSLPPCAPARGKGHPATEAPAAFAAADRPRLTLSEPPLLPPDSLDLSLPELNDLMASVWGVVGGRGARATPAAAPAAVEAGSRRRPAAAARRASTPADDDWALDLGGDGGSDMSGAGAARGVAGLSQDDADLVRRAVAALMAKRKAKADAAADGVRREAEAAVAREAAAAEAAGARAAAAAAVAARGLKAAMAAVDEVVDALRRTEAEHKQAVR